MFCKGCVAGALPLPYGLSSMAIFGYLTDMPLPDVLSMVGRSSGRFTVWNCPNGKNYELHLSQGLLCAMLVDSTPVEDVFQIRNRMVELMNMRTGEFEFQKQSASGLLSNFSISIDTLLLSSLAALDEMEAYRSFFASSRTVFTIVPTREAWLEGDLLEFWETCYPLLENGASAETIAQATNIYLDNILLALYKLRTAGLIAPVRAFQTIVTQTGGLKRAFASAPNKSGPLPNPPPPPPPQLMPVEQPQLETSPPVQKAPDLRKVAIHRPEAGTLSRILGRFFNSFKS